MYTRSRIYICAHVHTCMQNALTYAKSDIHVHVHVYTHAEMSSYSTCTNIKLCVSGLECFSKDVLYSTSQKSTYGPVRLWYVPGALSMHSCAQGLLVVCLKLSSEGSAYCCVM